MDVQCRAILPGVFRIAVHYVEAGIDGSRDADLELSLCKAIGSITARTRESGLTFSLDDHHAPGSRPVQVARRSDELRRRYRRAAGADRERER